MNKAEYFSELDKACDKFGIKKSEVIISHGGASLVFGYKDQTSDIDVSVSNEAYEKLKAAGLEKKVIPPFGKNPEWECVGYGNIDFHPMRPTWGKIDTILVRGYQVTNKFTLLKDRIDLAREKDLPDVLCLLEYAGFLSDGYKGQLRNFLNNHSYNEEASKVL